MPLYRRIARRGFSNYPFKVVNVAVNLDLIEKKYADGETVDMESLKAKGLVKKKVTHVKILGRGELSRKLTFNVPKLSAATKEKIEKAGGSVVTKEVKE
jgi:large subunit ribosomal protein L15